MARPLRIQYPGAVYHITCRGNERKDIFKDDVDRKTFLKILSESGKIYSIKIYAYVLMSNHFHLHIKTSLGNLSEFMRHFNITYTSHYNIPIPAITTGDTNGQDIYIRDDTRVFWWIKMCI
jgi:REP element-mobilizing transposase RayT